MASWVWRLHWKLQQQLLETTPSRVKKKNLEASSKVIHDFNKTELETIVETIMETVMETIVETLVETIVETVVETVLKTIVETIVETV